MEEITRTLEPSQAGITEALARVLEFQTPVQVEPIAYTNGQAQFTGEPLFQIAAAAAEYFSGDRNINGPFPHLRLIDGDFHSKLVAQPELRGPSLRFCVAQKPLFCAKKMAKYKSVNPGPNDFDPQIGPEFKCIGRDLVVIERKLQASVKANRTFPLVCQCRSPIYPPPGEFAEAMTKTNVPVVFKAICNWNIIIEIEPKGPRQAPTGPRIST